MNKDGQIVALLNDRQALVRMLDPDKFVVDREFAIFEVRDVNITDGPGQVELPKRGRMKVEALQSDGSHAVLTAWEITRQRVVKRPSPFQGLFADQVGLFGPGVEQVLNESIGKSASFDEAQSLNVRPADVVRVGDYVSAV
jgi:hypothetical protein